MTASPSPAPRPAPAPPASSVSPSTPAALPPPPSLGQLVSDASTHVSTLVRGEIELAKLELRSTVEERRVPASARSLRRRWSSCSRSPSGSSRWPRVSSRAGLWRWAAYLVVFGLQLLVVGVLVLIGIRKVKRVKAPEKTIETTKETVDYFKTRANVRE